MSAIPKIVEIPAGSEAAKLLREADEAPVVVVVDGARYHVLRERSTQTVQKDADAKPPADYDPDRVLEGMLAAAGAITPEEADRWIENLYRWREEGTRQADRK